MLQLSVINDVITRCADCLVVCGGDFNVDFNRISLHTKLLTDFCERSSLVPVLNHASSDVDYTYTFCMERFSTIDHFLVSESMFANTVGKSYVLHEIDNRSDHDPLFLQLRLNACRLNLCQRNFKIRPSWSKATDEHKSMYRQTLHDNLAAITVPSGALLCRRIDCRDADHTDAINLYVRCITEACLLAADGAVPHVSPPNDNAVPGWNDFVAPFREKSLFWHHVWIENGRPRHGVIADIMRRTRSAYHYAIKHVNRQREDIINERFAVALAVNNDRNFWHEAKRIRDATRSCSCNIDGLSSSNDIANLFAKTYEKLYASVSYDKLDIDDITDEIHNHLLAVGYSNDCIIACQEVREAIQRLKNGKDDGNVGLSSDYFIEAGDDLAVHIAMMFSAILVHGFVPDDFLVSTVVPLPKGHNANLSDSTNYRGIALSSIFGKIFDHVILLRCSNNLCSCDLQFGFRPKRSTDMCTMLLKETIAYYLSSNSSVYCIMLDATKAFDRVNYSKLFRELITRRLPFVYIRFLLYLYTNHVASVFWNGTRSADFPVLNGVRQGGVVSPILFCVYFDGLLRRLRDSRVGCCIGDVFVGALAYADDLTLLAPTPSGMRKLLAICESYAAEYNIIFNVCKSKCVYVAPYSHKSGIYGLNPIFFIGGKNIEYVDQWPHLGHIIASDFDDSYDIMDRRNGLSRQINNVLCFFAKRDPFVKLKLLFSYCYSFYGSVLWDLSHSHMERICSSWRMGVRRSLGLPNLTHSALLHIFSGTLPIFDELIKRTALFIQKCLSSDSESVRTIARMSVFHLRMSSPIGRNAFLCCARYGLALDKFVLVNPNFIHNSIYNKTDNTLYRTVDILHELLKVRSGFFQIPMFNICEVTTMIDCLSTT
jgi:hypothetical protein